MQTKNQALFKLYVDGVITEEAAMFYAGNRTEMRQMLKRWQAEQADEAKRRAEEEAKRARLRRQQQAQAAASGDGGDGAQPTPAPDRGPEAGRES